MNDSALAEAMTLHQVGRFAEAARLYRAILARITITSTACTCSG
jgi:protein O-GlcNAc transferase